jgi:hypothetical protein
MSEISRDVIFSEKNLRECQQHGTGVGVQGGYRGRGNNNIYIYIYTNIYIYVPPVSVQVYMSSRGGKLLGAGDPRVHRQRVDNGRLN